METHLEPITGLGQLETVLKEHEPLHTPWTRAHSGSPETKRRLSRQAHFIQSEEEERRKEEALEFEMYSMKSDAAFQVARASRSTHNVVPAFSEDGTPIEILPPSDDTIRLQCEAGEWSEQVCKLIDNEDVVKIPSEMLQTGRKWITILSNRCDDLRKIDSQRMDAHLLEQRIKVIQRTLYMAEKKNARLGFERTVPCTPNNYGNVIEKVRQWAIRVIENRWDAQYVPAALIADTVRQIDEVLHEASEKERKFFLGGAPQDKSWRRILENRLKIFVMAKVPAVNENEQAEPGVTYKPSLFQKWTNRPEGVKYEGGQPTYQVFDAEDQNQFHVKDSAGGQSFEILFKMLFAWAIYGYKMIRFWCVGGDKPSRPTSGLETAVTLIVCVTILIYVLAFAIIFFACMALARRLQGVKKKTGPDGKHFYEAKVDHPSPDWKTLDTRDRWALYLGIGWIEVKKGFWITLVVVDLICFSFVVKSASFLNAAMRLWNFTTGEEVKTIFPELEKHKKDVEEQTKNTGIWLAVLAVVAGLTHCALQIRKIAKRQVVFRSKPVMSHKIDDHLAVIVESDSKEGKKGKTKRKSGWKTRSRQKKIKYDYNNFDDGDFMDLGGELYAIHDAGILQKLQTHEGDLDNVKIYNQGRLVGFYDFTRGDYKDFDDEEESLSVQSDPLPKKKPAVKPPVPEESSFSQLVQSIKDKITPPVQTVTPPVVTLHPVQEVVKIANQVSKNTKRARKQRRTAAKQENAVAAPPPPPVVVTGAVKECMISDKLTCQYFEGDGLEKERESLIAENPIYKAGQMDPHLFNVLGCVMIDGSEHVLTGTAFYHNNRIYTAKHTIDQAKDMLMDAVMLNNGSEIFHVPVQEWQTTTYKVQGNEEITPDFVSVNIQKVGFKPKGRSFTLKVPKAGDLCSVFAKPDTGIGLVMSVGRIVSYDARTHEFEYATSTQPGWSGGMVLVDGLYLGGIHCGSRDSKRGPNYGVCFF